MDFTYFRFTMAILGASVLAASVMYTHLNRNEESSAQVLNNNRDQMFNEADYLNGRVTIRGRITRHPEDDLLNRNEENPAQVNDRVTASNNRTNDYLNGHVTVHGRAIEQPEDDFCYSIEGKFLKVTLFRNSLKLKKNLLI